MAIIEQKMFHLRIERLKILFPLFSTLIVYFITRWGIEIGIDVFYRISIVDLIILIIIHYFFYSLSKYLWIFIVLQILFISIFYIGNAMKIALLGGPVLPSDFYSFYALVLILQGIYRFYVLTPLVLFAILLIYNVKINKFTLSYSVIFFSSLSIITVFQPHYIVDFVDKNYEYLGWDHRHNWESMGAMLFLTQAFARNTVESSPLPNKDRVKSALHELNISPRFSPSNHSIKARNIYVYLVESLWDVNLLHNAHFNRDPLDERFRNLWESGGKSTVMSAEFGNTTANVEFELLCGQDAKYAKGVIFEHAIVNDVPCLPSILASIGYQTLAFHPNIPDFFNRFNAYRHLGFQKAHFEDDLRMDDMNESLLSDVSLFNQVLDTIKPRISSGQPIFTYVLTITGHWPYPLNPESRPHKIQTSSKIKEVVNYANSIYYTTSEIYESIEKIRHADPSAIIVIAGDHLPMLGENYAGYVESDFIDDFHSEISADIFKFSRSTPLMIIDGQNGILNVGDISMYELPKILLNLIQYTQFSPLDLFTVPEGFKVRSIYEIMHLVLHKQKNSVEYCLPEDSSADCEKTRQWLENTRIISSDLMLGKQYTLDLIKNNAINNANGHK